MPVVGECKHNPKLYCKNWDGIGAGGAASIVCPPNVKTCKYAVKPTPVPKLKTGGTK